MQYSCTKIKHCAKDCVPNRNYNIISKSIPMIHNFCRFRLVDTVATNSILLYRGGGGLVMNKVTVTADITAISVSIIWEL